MTSAGPKSPEKAASITTDHGSMLPRLHFRVCKDRTYAAVSPHLRGLIKTCPKHGVTSVAALWRDTRSVRGGTVHWWSWAESAEVKIWAADTYRKDTVLTNHQPEWMAQQQSSNCWPAICVVNSKFSMRLLVAPTQVERSLIPLWPFFPSQTFVAAMMKQLLTCPCDNLTNLLSQKTLKPKVKLFLKVCIFS